MKDFLKWFLETQLVKSKAPVWRDFFMNAIALVLILTYVVQTFYTHETSNEFNMLLSMILGFYFNDKSHRHDNEK